MEREHFEKLVIKALEQLPQDFKDCLDNLDVVVENLPDKNCVRSSGKNDVLLLGLYQGVPLSKRTRYYGMVMPDKISIFQKNIEKICKTDDEAVKTITHTIQHELAHHFGISDERLKELGIY